MTKLNGLKTNRTGNINLIPNLSVTTDCTENQRLSVR